MRIQNPAKHLSWDLQKQQSVFNRKLLLQNLPA